MNILSLLHFVYAVHTVAGRAFQPESAVLIKNRLPVITADAAIH
jgi:hypothetical protein